MNHRMLNLLAVVYAVLSVSCGLAAQGPRFSAARKASVVQTPLIKEASGIVASRKNVGVLWIHNDSGDGPRLYAVGVDGRLLGVYTVTGAQARDWEDIAAGPGPDPNQSYLYIGDIGDNNARYPSVRVYRVVEPDVNALQSFSEKPTTTVETIELTYPDGPKDAETLLVDPQTKDIYIVAKRELFCRVYMAAYPQPTTPMTMTHVATLPWALAVGGDVSPDGRYVIVRSLHNASLWTRPKGEPLWKAFRNGKVDLPLANEPQGEAIAFDAAGRGYFTISEMSNPLLYHFEELADGADGMLSGHTESDVNSP
jgi:hypothetical protein